MSWLALRAIGLYQRWISPYKGFRCAYAAHTGCASCSVLGARAIRRYGLRQGLSVLDARLLKCGVAHRRYQARPGAALRGQAGFLDCDCGGCDMPGSCDLPSPGKIADCAWDLLSCDCDWRKRRNAADEQYVVIPPRTGRRRPRS